VFVSFSNSQLVVVSQVSFLARRSFIAYLPPNFSQKRVLQVRSCLIVSCFVQTVSARALPKRYLGDLARCEQKQGQPCASTHRRSTPSPPTPTSKDVRL
jgi:hypothetical protein